MAKKEMGVELLVLEWRQPLQVAEYVAATDAKQGAIVANLAARQSTGEAGLEARLWDL